MDILQRLHEALKFSGLSVRAFSIKCGICQPTLDKQLKGLRAVSLDTIIRVIQAFPDVSSEWLLLGEGNMLKDKSDIETLERKNTERLIKLVDTITAMQETINAKDETIAMMAEHIRQLECQLNR